jgi:hypothetical protein
MIYRSHAFKGWLLAFLALTRKINTSAIVYDKMIITINANRAWHRKRVDDHEQVVSDFS